MKQVPHNSLWIVVKDMPARTAKIGVPEKDQEKITIKKGAIIEFRFHYGIHFRTVEDNYCFVTQDVLLEYCELYGQVIEKISWENKTNLEEILRLKLWTEPVPANMDYARDISS